MGFVRDFNKPRDDPPGATPTPPVAPLGPTWADPSTVAGGIVRAHSEAALEIQHSISSLSGRTRRDGAGGNAVDNRVDEENPDCSVVAAEVAKCQQCGHVLGGGKFCTKCGAEIKTTAGVTVVQATVVGTSSPTDPSAMF